MYKHSTDTTQPPRQASPATPPKEGNVPSLKFVDTFSTAPAATTPLGRSSVLDLPHKRDACYRLWVIEVLP